MSSSSSSSLYPPPSPTYSLVHGFFPLNRFGTSYSSLPGVPESIERCKNTWEWLCSVSKLWNREVDNRYRIEKAHKQAYLGYLNSLYAYVKVSANHDLYIDFSLLDVPFSSWSCTDKFMSSPITPPMDTFDPFMCYE